ncbi:MAG: hypothetical protein EXR95_06860 [Gemmatimonadetes bacterium]|nr:hypothetical protein [Gemmatimonadota bacterium]
MEPLRVSVRRASDLAPREGVEVLWDVIEGAGVTLGQRSSRTDSAGMASTAIVLGAQRGRYRVRARAREAAADFELWAVDEPVVDSVPGRARPGDTLRIAGRNFSPVLGHDLVELGGVRAEVVRATSTAITLRVPPCLPAGLALLRVSLGSQISAPRLVQIEPGATPAPFPVGAAVVLDAGVPGPGSCLRLPAGSYLLVLGATTGVSGARYSATMRALGGVPLTDAGAPGPDAGAIDRDATDREAQAAWDAELRAREARWIATPGPAGAVGVPPVGRAVGAAPPRVGDRREFNVLAPGGGFRRVSAVARRVTARAAFYEDVEAPAGQLTDEDYARFGASFDDPIAPTVTRIFGEPSDLDGNERVIVLFTPAVNLLTERESSDGFIGGFFYGLDLLPDRANSNRGEVFYALVPDPAGRFGDPRSRALVRSTVPTILAHELMHMVHFSERVVARGAAAGEATWLSEALAAMAEDRVGDAYESRGELEAAAAFQSGNRKRARLFVEKPGATSVLTAAGTATLPERGASWLFLRYLAEQYGGDDLLRSLTQTTRTGLANVASASERDWARLLLEWGTAVYDGEEAGLAEGSDRRNRYPAFRPRQMLGVAGQRYALRPAELDARGSAMEVDLLAGAIAHALVATDGPVTVGVGASIGSSGLAQGAVLLRIVRLH